MRVKEEGGGRRGVESKEGGNSVTRYSQQAYQVNLATFLKKDLSGLGFRIINL
jgi:hypothetical protein